MENVAVATNVWAATANLLRSAGERAMGADMELLL
jgi:hypothetical protein